MDLKEINELSDNLKFIELKVQNIKKDLEDVKELEFNLKKSTIDLQNAANFLEKKVASAAANLILKELDSYFKESKEIKKYAQSIDYSIKKLKELELKANRNIFSYLLTIFLTALATYFFIKFLNF